MVARKGKQAGFALYMKEMRRNAGLTQRELCDSIGSGHSYIGNIEKGHQAFPAPHYLDAIALVIAEKTNENPDAVYENMLEAIHKDARAIGYERVPEYNAAKRVALSDRKPVEVLAKTPAKTPVNTQPDVFKTTPVGEYIKQKRENTQSSIRGIAARNGISVSSLRRLEAGAVGSPRQETLEAIAQAIAAETGEIWQDVFAEMVALIEGHYYDNNLTYLTIYTMPVIPRDIAREEGYSDEATNEIVEEIYEIFEEIDREEADNAVVVGTDETISPLDATPSDTIGGSKVASGAHLTLTALAVEGKVSVAAKIVSAVSLLTLAGSGVVGLLVFSP